MELSPTREMVVLSCLRKENWLPSGAAPSATDCVPAEAASISIGNDGIVSAELAMGVAISSWGKFRLLDL